MRHISKIILFLVFSAIVNFSWAQVPPTKVMVRAKAKDAKFIGSTIGGALVTITNKATGQLLASGQTTGSTGNTQIIMKEPHQRRKPLTDENTSGYLAELPIEHPTYVEIAVQAPSVKKQAMATVTTEVWVIPGKHILGDGVVLEIPGYVIDILSPRTYSTTSTEDAVELAANIVMMCGCPISDGGTWDANQMEVAALLYKEGELLQEVEMPLASTNLFKTSLKDLASGSYKVIIYAYDPTTGNTGVDQTVFLISE